MGYTGTIDTFLRGTTEGDTNFSASTDLQWDENTGSTTDEIALIRFSGLFASEGGPIPNGTPITSASLTYMTTDLNSGSTADGDPANVYESLVDWPGTTVTCNNFGGEAGVQTDEYNNTLVASAPATARSTAFTIDVTASLQRWSDGTANFGWIFLPTADDGVNIYSSDYTTVSYRPLLTVVYEAETGPRIHTSVTSLAAFSAQPGVPSTSQSYTISGLELTDYLVITPPTGFAVSLDGSTYFSSLELEPVAGAVAPTTIYVRMYNATEADFSGNITHASTGATNKNVAVSGSVRYVYTLTVVDDGNGTVTLTPAGGSYPNGTTVTLTPVPNTGYIFDYWQGDNAGDIIDTGGVYTILMDEDKSITAHFAVSTCTDVSLTPSADVYMSEYNPGYSYGALDVFKVSNNISDMQRGTLLKWDLSAIPTDATISSASLTVYVSTSSTAVYNMYNMRRDWLEGTGQRTQTNDGASWNTYDGVNAWGTNGAANTTSDRYDTNLWGAGTTSFSTTGFKTVSLDADGLAVIQGWIAGTLSNFGLTIQNYTETTGSDELVMASKENATSANWPKLNLTYCETTTNPTIIVSGALSAFSAEPGVASAAQTYTVAGANLTADIVITAPTGFQLSTDSVNYYPSLTLTQSGGQSPPPPSTCSCTVSPRALSAAILPIPAPAPPPRL